jgi:hypothetical protein
MMTRSGAATNPDCGDEVLRGGRSEPQLRELHLTSPLSHAALATVARACPHLRVLHCVYGGPRPLVKMDQTAPLGFLSLVAEAVFIEWLGAILDIRAAKFLTARISIDCATAAHATTGQQQILHKLRRLQVANPPFDGERDAATMETLECVRAKSHALIAFN